MTSRGKSRSAGHSFDDLHLLAVLLPEIGAVRLDDVEKLGDNRRDAPEMARAVRAFQWLCDRARVDGCFEACRVYLLHRRVEHHGDPFLFQQGEVVIEVAWIVFEILGGTELGRVYKDGDGNRVVLGAGEAHQGEVSFMEKPHRRHQPQAPFHQSAGLAELADGVDGLQRLGPIPARLAGLYQLLDPFDGRLVQAVAFLGRWEGPRGDLFHVEPYSRGDRLGHVRIGLGVLGHEL